MVSLHYRGYVPSDVHFTQGMVKHPIGDVNNSNVILYFRYKFVYVSARQKLSK